jgi:hypothetical protein
VSCLAKQQSGIGQMAAHQEIHPLLDSLRDWQNFYVLMGGASATLTGLMFVAISLGMNLVRNDQTDNDIRTYVTPTLFHFVAVLLLAAITLMGGHTPLTFALLVGVVVLIGLWKVRGVMHLMRLQMETNSANHIREDNHWIWHGFLPLVAYGLAGCVAIGQLISTVPLLFMGLALAEIMLLLVAIRNTWLLVLWIARQR